MMKSEKGCRYSGGGIASLRAQCGGNDASHHVRPGRKFGGSVRGADRSPLSSAAKRCEDGYAAGGAVKKKSR